MFLSHRNNVGRVQNPDTKTAQGAFPEQLRTIEVRPSPDMIAHEDILAGSIEEGVAFSHDLYNTPVTHGDPNEWTRT